MRVKRKYGSKSLSLEIKVLFLHKIAADTKGGEEVRTAWRNITIWGSGARLRLRDT